MHLAGQDGRPGCISTLATHPPFFPFQCLHPDEPIKQSCLAINAPKNSAGEGNDLTAKNDF
jgi:hypothetical protein